MDLRYLNYSSEEGLFYKPANKNNADTAFKFEVNSDEWQIVLGDHWTSVVYEKNTLPEQGWKVHISSSVGQAQEVLNVVSEYLMRQRIDFKFVKSSWELMMKNSKYGDRSGSGKFITIYPKDVDEFVVVVENLMPILESFEKGPYILSDKRWKDSNIYFRYGGFKLMTTFENGQTVYAIKTPDGKLIPDKREPLYQLPDFIEEPEFVKKMSENQEKEFSDIDTTAFDKFEIISALHFSNGGGVYRAKRKKDGHDVLIKEGRKAAGIGANGEDGFSRVQSEANNIQLLQSVPTVVRYIDHFSVWESNFVVEEYLKGIDLNAFAASKFPFSRKQDRQEYSAVVIDILDQVYGALVDIHKLGIAIGDLQPSNIVVLDDHRVKLIDFETSVPVDMKYEPGLMTPGFVTSQAKNYGEADWFAFKRLVRYLFMPIAPVSDFSDDIENYQDDWIASEFGADVISKIRWFESRANDNLNFKRNYSFNVPSEKLSTTNAGIYIESFKNSLLKNVSEKIPQLAYGDIRQYENDFGFVSPAYGGFGTLMAIMRLGEPISHEMERWVDNFILEFENQKHLNFPIGLFTGISGIANILYEMGKHTESEKLLEYVNSKINDYSGDLTLMSGLPGIGLSFLNFYALTNDEKYINQASNIFNMILEAINSDKTPVAQDVDGISHGLMNGWAGVALFALKLGQTLSDGEVKRAAKEILNLEIANVETDELTGVAQVKDKFGEDDRLVPYLAEGSAGLGLVILEFIKEDGLLDAEDLNRLPGILEINGTYSFYSAGLFRGATGFIVLANAISEFKKSSDELEFSLRRMNNYIVSDDNGEYYLPGDFGFKFSNDIATGSAGILAALSDIGSGKWNSWVPLAKNDKFEVFSL